MLFIPVERSSRLQKPSPVSTSEIKLGRFEFSENPVQPTDPALA